MNRKRHLHQTSQNAMLAEPPFERDACGVGLVANITGEATNGILSDALVVLDNLEHRGATGAIALTGDGAGVMMQMPDRFFRGAASEAGIGLPEGEAYGVGMVFLPMAEERRAEVMGIMEDSCSKSGLRLLGWRAVPVDPGEIGSTAASVMPFIAQCFAVPDGGEIDSDAFERRLFLARKRAEKGVATAWQNETPPMPRDDFYVCSFSSRVIVYKGMLLPYQVPRFFKDFSDPKIACAFAMVHSRFSTNTLGEWKLAHPYRMLSHNGEINTVRGNRNWMSAREKNLRSDLYTDDEIRDLAPVCARAASDTASFDNVFELLVMAGRSASHAASMMIPAAWYGNDSMPRQVADFYEYHFGIMEPWDGPAMMVLTDGKSLCATLDRNGLRPFRYCVTKDNKLVMASETGVLPIEPERVLLKDRLAPGRMFVVNFEEKRIVPYEEVIDGLASRKPYGEWLKKNRLALKDLPEAPPLPRSRSADLRSLQVAFGYTREDLNLIISPMAKTGMQPTGSMGNDAALAVFSDRPQPLYNYFKQLFAQVSNPPLDSIREKLVTQMAVGIGRHSNLFGETPNHCALLRVDNPIIQSKDLAKIHNSQDERLKSVKISTLLSVSEGTEGIGRALNRIHQEADAAIENGCAIIILSDRGVSSKNAYLPALLAVASLHHHLIRNGSRLQADIIVESGEPREVHHFATLFGYGASVVNPYIALETLEELCYNSVAGAELPFPEPERAGSLYVKAAESGVLKTIAKMGISTLQGYMGAQQFEALGISQEVIDQHFTWTASRIGGIGLKEMAADILANHSRAFPATAQPSAPALDVSGLYHWRSSGERHGWNPDTIALLQDASKRNDWEVFQRFEEASNCQTAGANTVRALLELDYPKEGISLEEVEPAEKIVKRFATGAISLGSISKEAHETLAVAMNRIGARSNTGEGGEDPERFSSEANGDSRNSAVKQIATGRFGVTTNYMANASDLQIKMAQGAKPGEGGELARP